MTLSAFVNYEAAYIQQSPIVYLNLDVQATLGGSLGPSVTLTVPVAAATLQGYGNVFSCVLFQGATPIQGIAYLAIVGSSLVIRISRYDNANFAAGSLEIKLTGLYRTS
jgi:hypothetical protein